jgi:hypothetical protein
MQRGGLPLKRENREKNEKNEKKNGKIQRLKDAFGNLEFDVGFEVGLQWDPSKPVPEWVAKFYVKIHRRIKNEQAKGSREENRRKRRRNNDGGAGQ